MNQNFLKLLNIAGKNTNALDNIRKRLFMYKHTTGGLSPSEKIIIETYIEILKEKINIIKHANKQFKKELEKQARDLRKYKLDLKRKRNDNNNFNLNNFLSKYEKELSRKVAAQNNFNLNNLLSKYEKGLRSRPIQKNNNNNFNLNNLLSKYEKGLKQEFKGID